MLRNMSIFQRLCAPAARQLTQFKPRNVVAHHQPSIAQGSSRLQQVTNTNCCTSLLSRCMASLSSMHNSGPRPIKHSTKATVLRGCPQKRGVVIKVMIKKPKKPNSANRKCVRVRLTNGNESTAYVPGEGHILQEHSIVLVRGGRLKDVPGVKLKCVRGKYDLAHVKKKVM